MDFTTLIAGPIGGLLGIVGNVANTLLSMKQEKQNHDFELARIPLQLNADIERTKAQVAMTVEEGAGKAFTASQESARVTGRESKWVLNIVAMVRPVSLFLLFAVVVALYFSKTMSTDMHDFIINNVVTDFSMALSWYFGARASAKVMQGFKSKAGS